MHNNYRENYKPTPFADGSYVSKAAFEEWRDIAEEITLEIKWQSGEIVMLDNTRYLHGRRQQGPERELHARFSYSNIT